ncbi:succinylglutamate desuccinylase/aspartoacylase domain-containing protein [Phyllobacterium endophyticum]|nr:succinylglutamate desuccinylase/aspartoacylase family protein [Phyllobacterium endophyticum]MBB3236723.1 hypothetical protein [Phyllobacterium endophyticum]
MSMITSSISLDDDGVRYGHLRIPHSVHESAYGHIPVPIAVAKQGAGPTLLLTAGVHGDEYEGPLALYGLLAQLEKLDISGRLIILPSINQPAFLAATRCSPIDKLNLNRSFPGSPNGSITQLIADYISTELLHRADYAIDMHSGGSSLQYLPLLLAPTWPDGEKRETIDGLVKAFSSPLVGYFDSLRALDGGNNVFGHIADKHNCHLLTGEFGGGSTVNLDGLSMLSSGLRRIFRHIGLTTETIEEPDRKTAIRCLSLHDPDLFAFSPAYGIFEPAYKLGDELAPGALAGRIFDATQPWKPPVEIRFRSGGLAICIRTFAMVKPGDCLGHLATDL